MKWAWIPLFCTFYLYICTILHTHVWVFYFPEMMKHSRGQYSDLQIDRCSHIAGSFGKEMDRLMSCAGFGNIGPADARRSSHSSPAYCRDVQKFVEEYIADGLFSYAPGRTFKGFKDFIPQRHSRVKAPFRLGLKLHELAADMDYWEGIARATRMREHHLA